MINLKNQSKPKMLSLRTELEAVFTKLGYTVVIGQGDFHAGTCVVLKDKKVVVNKFTPLEQQIDFLVHALGEMDLSNVFLLPEIREMIDEQATIFR
ncbi:MAG: hypothetical protein PHW79_07085 [Candidatus Marinimicrobia bacterium]|nr:hypothetical protein [Candidatus Neomarinimicrobiota bacterium]